MTGPKTLHFKRHLLRLRLLHLQVCITWEDTESYCSSDIHFCIPRRNLIVIRGHQQAAGPCSGDPAAWVVGEKHLNYGWTDAQLWARGRCQNTAHGTCMPSRHMSWKYTPHSSIMCSHFPFVVLPFVWHHISSPSSEYKNRPWEMRVEINCKHQLQHVHFFRETRLCGTRHSAEQRRDAGEKCQNKLGQDVCQQRYC